MPTAFAKTSTRWRRGAIVRPSKTLAQRNRRLHRSVTATAGRHREFGELKASNDIEAGSENLFDQVEIAKR